MMDGSPPDSAQAVPQPHDIDAEQAVLGSLLINNEVADRIGGLLEPDHFYDPVHQRIYEAARDAIARGQLASPVTLKPLFAEDKGLADLGGPQYFVRLAEAVVSVASTPEYAKQIVEFARRRQVITSAQEMIARASSDFATSVEDQVDDLSAALDQMREQSGGIQRLMTMATVLNSAAELTEAALKGGGAGFKTGIADLDLALGGLYAGDLTVIGGRPAMGKAQPLDAGVLMADGSWKRMGEIRLADRLASVDGTASIVSGIFPQGRRPIYRVTFSDGRSVRACSEHLWEVHSSRFKGTKVWDTLQIADVLRTKRYERRLCVPLHCGEHGQKTDLPLDPWLLGALIGNGCLCKEQPSLSTADAGTLWRFQQAVAAAAGSHRIRASGGYDYAIAGDDGPNMVTAALKRLGLHGSRSTDKHLPDLYLQADLESRFELLRGLMDTDGWVEKTGAVCYSSSSGRLAQDVQRLVRSVGGICSITSRIPKYTHNGEQREGERHFTCYIRHPDPASLFHLERKARRCGRKAPPKLTIVSVEFDGPAEAQCITVTHPRRLYVTDGYTCTHNSAVAAGLLKRQVEQPGRAALFMSLEMTAEQNAWRMISEWLTTRNRPVPYSEFRRGTMTNDQFMDYLRVSDDKQGLPLFWTGPDVRSLAAIEGEARRYVRKAEARGLDAGPIVIDYLNLITLKASTPLERITMITARLKEMALRLKVPVVLLAQLNRGVEAREDKRPVMSDLRESGSIEQDADNILLLYRDEYYAQKEKPAENAPEDKQQAWSARLALAANKLEIILGKVRSGDGGTVKVGCDLAHNHFWDLERGR